MVVWRRDEAGSTTSFTSLWPPVPRRNYEEIRIRCLISPRIAVLVPLQDKAGVVCISHPKASWNSKGLVASRQHIGNTDAVPTTVGTTAFIRIHYGFANCPCGSHHHSSRLPFRHCGDARKSGTRYGVACARAYRRWRCVTRNVVAFPHSCILRFFIPPLSFNACSWIPIRGVFWFRPYKCDWMELQVFVLGMDWSHLRLRQQRHCHVRQNEVPRNEKTISVCPEGMHTARTLGAFATLPFLSPSLRLRFPHAL